MRSNCRCCRSILALFSDPFQLAPLAFQFGLIGIDLFLLVGLAVLLSLELISDQGAGAQSQCATDRRASAWVAYRRADNTAERPHRRARRCPRPFHVSLNRHPEQPTNVLMTRTIPKA